MKLIYASASPFVRKVRVLTHEAGIADQVDLISVATSPLATAAEVRAANPVGKIPALIRPDGPAIYDSRVICRYLDDKMDAGLYPEDEIWEVLTLEATADGIMDAAVLMVYEGRLRPNHLIFDDWVEGQWSKVTGALDALNERWMGMLNGPLNMGQIAVACALGYLDFRHGARNWRDGRGALDDWYAVFSERDSMKATMPQ